MTGFNISQTLYHSINILSAYF